MLVGSDLVYGDGQAGPCMALVHGCMAAWWLVTIGGYLEMTTFG